MALKTVLVIGAITHTRNRNSKCKKSRSSLHFLDNRKWITFPRKNDDSKLWVEVIIVFLVAVAIEDVLTANNYCVNLLKTRTFLFDDYKSSSLFDRINKLDRNYAYSTYWQALSLVCRTKSSRDVAFVPSILKPGLLYTTRDTTSRDQSKVESDVREGGKDTVSLFWFVLYSLSLLKWKSRNITKDCLRKHKDSLDSRGASYQVCYVAFAKKVFFRT